MAASRFCKNRIAIHTAGNPGDDIEPLWEPAREFEARLNEIRAIDTVRFTVVAVLRYDVPKDSILDTQTLIVFVAVAQADSSARKTAILIPESNR